MYYYVGDMNQSFIQTVTKFNRNLLTFNGSNVFRSNSAATVLDHTTVLH